ncbi:MAG TPA: type VI secretion system tube protein Hcp [Pyrinomonadaceae bacterium]|jgi:type VI secretion system secreted protein Hcp|nr:type VI secretion system tube protein Hcp [Pyrinomonadaceae bacterium]
MAAVDYFLKIGDIDGESADSKYSKNIEIESFSWGANQTGSSSHGGGAGAGKVSMQDLHFVMKINKASPKLFLACASGQHIPKAVLVARKAGGQQEDYLKFTLTDVLVSSYQSGGSAHSDVVPTDQVSLNFSKLEMEYKEQTAKGTLAGTVKAGWDIKTNKKV